MNIDIAFCRRMLAELAVEIKAKIKAVRVFRDGWVYHFHRDHWEFHGPDGFYWNGRAANAYDARYKGWSAWLDDYERKAAQGGHNKEG